MDTEIIREGDRYIHVVAANEDAQPEQPEADVVIVPEAQAPTYTQTLVADANNIEGEVTAGRPDATDEADYRQELDEEERG